MSCSLNVLAARYQLNSCTAQQLPATYQAPKAGVRVQNIAKNIRDQSLTLSSACLARARAALKLVMRLKTWSRRTSSSSGNASRALSSATSTSSISPPPVALPAAHLDQKLPEGKVDDILCGIYRCRTQYSHEIAADSLGYLQQAIPSMLSREADQALYMISDVPQDVCQIFFTLPCFSGVDTEHHVSTGLPLAGCC